ncbi:hypothetical protein [Novosphingobium olei]|uniref:Uncharacterized protein n=1 Tax=Novosphingobium olei TaxID=2728851 RepID=A0A7Y0BSI6_9SPHN|nr:hypothetical protein [Novosphingobium olei]NML95146.1 hypothetical protein [Novosphingobium olei]
MTKQKRAKEPTKKLVATFVRGNGTDDEIRARCEAEISGWIDLSPKAQSDMIRIMREVENRPVSPAVSLRTDGEAQSVGPDETTNLSLYAARMTDTFASGSNDYCDQRLSEIARYSQLANKRVDPRFINASLAFVNEAAAEDAVQSTLAVQMAATHDAALWALARVRIADMAPQVQLFGNLATKLLNAYTKQAETLAKLQRGGEQVVKHIHIDNRGGQAVVTDQVVTGGANAESREQPFGGVSPALLGSHPFGEPLPAFPDQGQETVPIARGPISGSAEG